MYTARAPTILSQIAWSTWLCRFFGATWMAPPPTSKRLTVLAVTPAAKASSATFLPEIVPRSAPANNQ
jgi:hypothetical protein